MHEIAHTSIQNQSPPPLPPKLDSPIKEQQLQNVPPVPKRVNSVESPKKEIPPVSNYDPWDSHPNEAVQKPEAPSQSQPANLPPIPARQIGTKPTGAIPPIPARAPATGSALPPVPARGAPAIPPRKT